MVKIEISFSDENIKKLTDEICKQMAEEIRKMKLEFHEQESLKRKAEEKFKQKKKKNNISAETKKALSQRMIHINELASEIAEKYDVPYKQARKLAFKFDAKNRRK